jgi:subtilase family serine protease
MLRIRSSVALSGAAAALAISAGAATAATPRTTLTGSASPAAAKTPSVGAVPGDSSIDFEVALQLPNQSALQSFVQAVSTPGNAQYGNYLTPAQFESRFAPSQQTVDQVTSYLKQQGFTNIQASADRMAVDATGTATQIEQTFSTSMTYHSVHGQRLRLADRSLSVPTSVAGAIAGVSGVSDTLQTPQNASGTDPETGGPATTTPAASGPIPQPPGFRVAPPCNTYYDQAVDTTLPAFGNGYPSNPPWAICGYNPPQLRSAYGLNGADNGAGVTVGIVDAYASPTIFGDAQHYASLNDPANPLSASQFSEKTPDNFTKVNQCDASGWFGEETLDVEAVHATAPGANVIYSGAKSCSTPALNRALRKLVDKHLADVISNSYGDDGGDVLDSAGDRQSTDDILLMADATGISVMFSSGDDGDEFTTVGQVAADYPASSPWATAAGGTSLQIGSAGQRIGEFGWSTARSFLCNQAFINEGGCKKKQLNQWLPIDLALDGGSGGGTSVVYPQPFYQRGVVPNALSEVNGSTPMRVEPDVSMDADPATGFLEGETQTFPDGVYYDQYRIGGTSVSSPLLAGVTARADETAGHALGFLNADLYGIAHRSGAYDDIGPAGKQLQSRPDFVNSIDDTDGITFTDRIIDYEGPDQFCDSNGNCTNNTVALHATPGYDNMTGLGSPGANFVNALAGH